MTRLLARVGALFAGRRQDREMDEEIAAHLEFAAAEFEAQGVDPGRARQAARRSFGSITAAKEAERESRRFAWLDDVGRDLRYAMRGLRRDLPSTLAIVTTLALGIGATTIIFSAVDAVLLKSLPFAEPERVVGVHGVIEARATANPAAGDLYTTFSYPDYLDVRDSGVLQSAAAYASVSVTLDAKGMAERIDAQIVSHQYFDVLGVHAAIGRFFAPSDDRPESPVRVAVLSHRAWQLRYGGDENAIGRTVGINGAPHTVIGVAPAGFFGAVLGVNPEVWLPMALQPDIRPPSAGALRQRYGLQLLPVREVSWLQIVGRLKPGVSVQQTTAALDVIGRRLAAAYPSSHRDRTLKAMQLGDAPGVRTRALPTLRILGVAVSLVLLIACANVAGLQLARAVARRREVAVRVAIGAGRFRLVRQWLTEAMLLGVLGAAGGLLIAWRGIPLLNGLGVLDGVDVAIDRRVLVFALAAGVGTGLLFGLAPALQVIAPSVTRAVRDEAGVAGGRRNLRLRSAFVVVQVALSLVLLIGAGLFVETFRQALAVDLGYQIDRMLLADVTPGDRYTPETAAVFYRRLVERISAVPGVTSAAAARIVVLSGDGRTLPVSADGQPLKSDRSNAMPVRVNIVSDSYFRTMGIPVIRGRDLLASDVMGAPRVAVVSQSLAARLWPGHDPIGQTLVGESQPATVVGVVPDTVSRSPTARDQLPAYYVALQQTYEARVTLHLRTAGDPLALLPAVRQALRDLDPQIALDRPRRLTDEFSRSTAPQRTMASLTGSLAVLASLLAGVGLFGLMAYTARQRTGELGLRLALGASYGSIFGFMIRRGAGLIAIGVVLGLAGAAAGTRIVQSQLFGVEPTDPATWLTVSALLIGVGLLACAIPARRAARVDPAVALRTS